MQSLLTTIASFLAALAVLISVHEFGHFWVARRLGVKVLRFSIGFGRPIWSRRFGPDQTEFALAAIPLGGYVKMVDEREGAVEPADLPRAFNRQSLRVRTAVVLAGPVFNLIFAVLAYWLIFIVGDVGTRPLVGAVTEGSIAAQGGFRSGDELLAVGDRATPTWESAVFGLLIAASNDGQVTVRVRDTDRVERTRWIGSNALYQAASSPGLLRGIGLSPYRPKLPAVIGELVVGEAAERAGLRPGDRILEADDQTLADWDEWVSYVQAHPEQTLQLRVQRGSEVLSLDLHTSRRMVGDREIGRIGASVEYPEALLDSLKVEVRYGPLAALGASVQKTRDLSTLMLRILWKMLVGEASVDNLSGPISIAQTAGQSASFGLLPFVKFLALISVSLGVLNLLPIPILDGGHLLFFLIEAVKGSPLSEEAQLGAQRVGLAILIGLMGLALYVDLGRLFQP